MTEIYIKLILKNQKWLHHKIVDHSKNFWTRFSIFVLVCNKEKFFCLLSHFTHPIQQWNLQYKMVSRYFSFPSHPSIWDLLAQQYVLLPTHLFEAQQIATAIMCHYLALLQHFAIKHWGQKGRNRKYRVFQASAACSCRSRKSMWFGIAQLQRTEQLKTHGTRNLVLKMASLG